MNAEQARKLVAHNEKRKKEIDTRIQNGHKAIKSACKNGLRRAYANYRKCEGLEYPEVIEHFKELGYKVTKAHPTNVIDIEW